MVASTIALLASKSFRVSRHNTTYQGATVSLPVAPEYGRVELVKEHAVVSTLIQRFRTVRVLLDPPYAFDLRFAGSRDRNPPSLIRIVHRTGSAARKSGVCAQKRHVCSVSDEHLLQSVSSDELATRGYHFETRLHPGECTLSLYQERHLQGEQQCESPSALHGPTSPRSAERLIPPRAHVISGSRCPSAQAAIGVVHCSAWSWLHIIVNPTSAFAIAPQRFSGFPGTNLTVAKQSADARSHI